MFLILPTLFGLSLFEVDIDWEIKYCIQLINPTREKGILSNLLSPFRFHICAYLVLVNPLGLVVSALPIPLHISLPLSLSLCG